MGGGLFVLQDKTRDYAIRQYDILISKLEGGEGTNLNPNKSLSYILRKEIYSLVEGSGREIKLGCKIYTPDKSVNIFLNTYF